MTTLIIDNKATAKKSYEKYIVDRNEYPTIEDVINVMYEMINNETYLIRLFVDNEMVKEIRA